MEKEEWASAKIPKRLWNEVKSFVSESRVAADYGFTNPSQFVTYAVRDTLRRLRALEEPRRSRLEHVNTFEDYVAVLDNDLDGGRIVRVYVRQRDWYAVGFCDYCQTFDCIHVDFMYEVPKAVEGFKRKGLKEPTREYREMLTKEYVRKKRLEEARERAVN